MDGNSTPKVRNSIHAKHACMVLIVEIRVSTVGYSRFRGGGFLASEF